MMNVGDRVRIGRSTLNPQYEGREGVIEIARPFEAGATSHWLPYSLVAYTVKLDNEEVVTGLWDNELTLLPEDRAFNALP